MMPAAVAAVRRAAASPWRLWLAGVACLCVHLALCAAAAGLRAACAPVLPVPHPATAPAACAVMALLTYRLFVAPAGGTPRPVLAACAVAAATVLHLCLHLSHHVAAPRALRCVTDPLNAALIGACAAAAVRPERRRTWWLLAGAVTPAALAQLCAWGALSHVPVGA